MLCEQSSITTGRAGRLIIRTGGPADRGTRYQRQMQPFALNGGRESGRDVEVHGVAKLIGLGGTAGLDGRWPGRVCHAGQSWNGPASQVNRRSVL